MSVSVRKNLYLVLAVIGVCVTWYFNLQFMRETGGFSLVAFVNATYVNAASASISNDLLVVVAAFLLWSFFEARALGMRHWWVVPLLTFSIAIAFAMPLFLYLRERALEARAG